MKNFVFIFGAILALVLMGCCPQPPIPVAVDKVPILWNSSVGPMGSSKSIVVSDFSDTERQCALMSPIVTGWQPATYYVGDSYTSSVFGNTITTTISQNGDDIVFTGVFNSDPDGGGYVLIYHPDGTFDFEQNIIIEIGDAQWYVISIFTGDTSVLSYSFTGTGKTYGLSYSPVDGTALTGYQYTTHVMSDYFGLLITDYVMIGDQPSAPPSFGDTSFIATIDAAEWTPLGDGNMPLVTYTPSTGWVFQTGMSTGDLQ